MARRGGVKASAGALLAVLFGWLGAGELLSAGCAADLAVSDGDAGEVGPPDPCTAASPPSFCTPPETGVSSCLYGKPDGVCDITAEDCTCEDCAGMALCTGACIDDGVCRSSSGEDCSCLDCYRRSAGCAPRPVGCHTDGICSALDDDCVCPDCALDRYCQSCAGNGYCAEYLEACSCADCQGSPRCAADAGIDADGAPQEAGQAGGAGVETDASETDAADGAGGAHSAGGAGGSGGGGGASSGHGGAVGSSGGASGKGGNACAGAADGGTSGLVDGGLSGSAGKGGT